jgi:hypothetical protein
VLTIMSEGVREFYVLDSFLSLWGRLERRGRLRRVSWERTFAGSSISGLSLHKTFFVRHYMHCRTL